MTAAGHAEAESKTPILDRLAPLPQPPRFRARRWPGTLIAVGVAAAVAIIGPATTSNPAQAWALLLLALFLAVALHELAHAAVAALVGFTVREVKVGPFYFQFRPELSFRLARKDFGKSLTVFAPATAQGLARRGMLATLAGPCANLVAAGVIASLPFPFTFFLGAFCLNNLAVGIGNLLPFRTRGGQPSDGLRIWTCLRSPAAAERWLALARLSADQLDGVASESLPSELIDKALAARDRSPERVAALLFGYFAAAKERRYDDAAQHIEACLELADTLAPSGRATLQRIAASVQAERRGRIDLAEQWLAEIPDTAEFAAQRALGKSAILNARGDYAGALTELGVAEQGFSRNADPARRRIVVQELAEWRGEINKNAAKGTAAMPTGSAP